MADINLYTALAIQRLRPDVGFALDGVDYKNIIWNSDNVVPLLDDEVEKMVLVIKAEEETKISAKQAAVNKLMALGLTKEEALALGK